jgi:nitroreductase
MKQKETPTDNPINDLIKNRWSPVAFDDRPIERETIFSLFEAARWAPSCFNEQPWSFIIAEKSKAEDFTRMLACLSEANREWAQSAYLLIISVAKLHFDHNGKSNRHAQYDTGAATISLVLQATALGLHAHQMAGFSVERAREVYQIPESHQPLTAIAVGYGGDPDALPENLRKRNEAPRKRKPISEFIYTGSWQHQYVNNTSG